MTRVKAGDLVIHLQGEGRDAVFEGFSIAASDGYETSERPPQAGEWSHADTFYRVRLTDFKTFDQPKSLYDVLREEEEELRRYFRANKNKKGNAYRRLFFVIQAGRLQCLNGAYLSEVDMELAEILFGKYHYPLASGSRVPQVQEVQAKEVFSNLRIRIGQNDFSRAVRDNYDQTCCFPECEIRESRFLIGAHIARWADIPELRGQVCNGICLCLMHDKAFEEGLFTVSWDHRVWTTSEVTEASFWAKKNILPYVGQKIKPGRVPPSEEALLHHWERTNLYPDFG